MLRIDLTKAYEAARTPFLNQFVNEKGSEDIIWQ